MRREYFIKDKVVTFYKKKPHIAKAREKDGSLINLSEKYDLGYIYLFRDDNKNQYQFVEKPFFDKAITEEDRLFAEHFTEENVGRKFIISAKTNKGLNVSKLIDAEIDKVFFIYEPVFEGEIL